MTSTRSRSRAARASRSELTGKPTAFRPPGYAYLLGGAYRLFGAQAEADRIRVARRFSAPCSACSASRSSACSPRRFWGRRIALIAMALAAIYVPSLFVATAIMSEQLFVVLMLAALVVALALKDSPHPYRLAVAAGLLTGLAVLTRANGLILLAPLAFAAWRSSWRAAAILVAVTLVTVAPWTIRNAYELHAFVPTTTQLGWALAGTYNDQARIDPDNPASWRSLFRVPELRAIDRRHPGEPEAERERRWRVSRARVHRRAPDLRGDGRLLEHAPAARPRLAGLVTPHRLDGQRDPRLVGRGRASASGCSPSWRCSRAGHGPLPRSSGPSRS